MDNTNTIVISHRVQCPCGGAFYTTGKRNYEKHIKTFIHRYYKNHGYPIDKPICFIE